MTCIDDDGDADGDHDDAIDVAWKYATLDGTSNVTIIWTPVSPAMAVARANVCVCAGWRLLYVAYMHTSVAAAA